VVRHLASWLLWWAAFFWLWLFLTGDWNRIEVIGAACGAVLGATVAEIVRDAVGVSLAVPLERLRASTMVLPVVFADFAIVMATLARSLVRREARRGAFVTRTSTPEAIGNARRRAWTVLSAGFSPNAYVIDFDPEAGTVLLHDLVPWRKSEEPA